MEKIKEYLQKPLYSFICGVVLGIIIGLPILGWWLFPVEWTDAGPADLRQDVKADYLRMAVESYAKNKDQKLAMNRWAELGKEGETLLGIIQTDPKLTPQEISQFGQLVKADTSGIVLPTSPSTGLANPQATAPEAPGSAGLNPLVLILVFFGLTLLIGGLLAYFFILRKRPEGESIVESIKKVFAEKERVIPEAEYIESDEPPIAQFMTTYSLGDDLYDDSFSIDSPTGEFLGECGVGISETIGVGDPKKVTAFEVWLFDKNDIQTITKVFLSDYAFNDAAISQRLISKGEPVLLENEKHVLLETATLQLEARVVDVAYGQGAMPQNSFVDRMTLELSVWPKFTE